MAGVLVSPPRPSWSEFVRQPEWLEIERCCTARYVECRLHSRRHEIDYLMAFPRSSATALRAHLAEAVESASTASPARWRPLLRLLESWGNGASLLSRYAPVIWFELDDASSCREANAPFPSVSVCLLPGYDPRRSTPPPKPALELQKIDEITSLLEVPGSERLRSTLAECYRLLPANAQWIHLSLMLGRKPAAMKLYGAFGRSDLLPYLRALGWQGDFVVLARLLSNAYPAELLGDQVFVDLNLTTLHDAESCTLGLAVGQQHVLCGPRCEPLHGELLRRWAEVGWADPLKARSVQAVIGAGATADLPNRVKAGRFLDLKLVWSRQSGTVAKAYLGFHHQAAELPWSIVSGQELARLDDEWRDPGLGRVTALETPS
jgi:hypothetical protein